MGANQITRMGDMPPQKQLAASTDAQKRAVYFNPATAFMRKLAPVPDESFVREPERAFDPTTPTSVIYCDRSEALSSPFRATTPHLLARYIVVRSNDHLVMETRATGLIYFVIQGSGRVQQGATSIEWVDGDIFLLPGGDAATLSASKDAILWAVGNEPLLAFEGLRPAEEALAPIVAVHYPASEIAKQIALMYSMEKEESTAGRAVIFSSDAQIDGRNIMPTLSLAYNTLEPHTTQRAHRHNSVAVTLAIQGEGCYSTVDERRKDWVQWSTSITPPCARHSHHNDGEKRALFLIVQDGGVYTNARASGFSFD